MGNKESGTHTRQEYLDAMLIGAIALLFFLLQARYLHLAAAFYTDEASHVEPGRLIFSGLIPYRDFLYLQPPLFPLFAGIFLKLTSGMYPVRLLYLFLNISSTIPFFFVLKKIGNNRAAALMGVLFYLLYHEMVHHDMRFLALRQFSNILLIWFLFVTVVTPNLRQKLLWQILLIVSVTLSFFPALPNVALLCSAITISASSSDERRAFLRRFALLAAVSFVTLLLLFLLIPHSFENTVLDHIGAIKGEQRLYRMFSMMHWGGRESLLFVFSITSLILGSIFLKSMRFYALAALGMVIMVLLPAEFYPHYFVTAAIGLAIGVAVGTLLLYEIIFPRFTAVASLLCALAVGGQLVLVAPSLLSEWAKNRQPAYYQLIRHLAIMPEPFLTFRDQIYAIDAKKRIVYDYKLPSIRYLWSVKNEPVDKEEMQRLASQACTILLPPIDLKYLPKELVDDWKNRYVSDPFMKDPQTIILHTNNPGCG